MATSDLYSRMCDLYDATLFSFGRGNVVIDEPHVDKKTLTKHVTVELDQDRIDIPESTLSDNNKAYCNNSTPNLREVCDRVIITEKNEQLYIVLVELKSQFKSFCKGAAQLYSSGIKITARLMPLTDFLPEKYKFVAIVACQKPTVEEIDLIQGLIDTKGKLEAKDDLKYKAFYNDLVRNIDITIDQYQHNKLPLKTEYQIGNVPFVIYTLPSNNDTGSFKLDDVLSII